MRRKLIQAGYLCVMAAIGLMASSCVLATPGYTAGGGVIYADEAHRGTVHDYYYYPDVDIYFDPGIRLWYWNDGGRWRNDRALPRHYRIDEGRRYMFRSDAREPYRVHDRVIRDYRARGNEGRNRRPVPPPERGRPDYRGDTDRGRR